MPLGVFTSIREVSSEDEVHSAENLLKEQAGKKWKTREAGEKSAYVILEMAEPRQIAGIDIGNEHSAFIEVLVGQAGCRSDDFTEILLSSSFMTPSESKSSSIANRVRCFNKQALVPDALPKKWKLVKIICTQPYNRHVQYGLSFIKVHVIDDSTQPKKEPAAKSLLPEKYRALMSPRESKEDSKQTKPPSAFSIGKFSLRADSPDSESESTTALFSRWKRARNTDASELPTAAATIRQASNNVMKCSTSNGTEARSPANVATATRTTKEAQDRNRECLMFGDDEEGCSDKGKRKRLEKQIDKDRERLEDEHRRRSKQYKPTAKASASSTRAEEKTPVSQKINGGCGGDGGGGGVGVGGESEATRGASAVHDKQERKRKSSPIHMPAKRIQNVSAAEPKYRPFRKLLSGVVLVISGIQNPDRGILRTKALDLGAIYKADWQPGCTHLICAFKNTPKYNQVKGKGKIVTRAWIEKCHEQKKYLPWRRFALDAAEQAQPASDEELLDESLQPAARVPFPHSTTVDMYDLSDKEGAGSSHEEDNANDTDDEIERIVQTVNSHKVKQDQTSESGVYGENTDEEDYLQEKLKKHSGQTASADARC